MVLQAVAMNWCPSTSLYPLDVTGNKAWEKKMKKTSFLSFKQTGDGIKDHKIYKTFS